MSVQNGSFHNIYLQKAPNILLPIKVKVALSTKRRDYIFSNILKIFAKQGHEATFISVEVVEEVRGDGAEGEEADHGAHQAEGQLVVQVAEQHRLQHQHYAA